LHRPRLNRRATGLRPRHHLRQKSIGSDTKQIDAYRAKVNNPRANQPNWNSLSRDQQGALMRQWNDEIRRHEASRATAQRMLSQKAR
jgi:acyl-CoA reductase-like NAD-dependent aldehyde dehydrogenase